MRRSLAVGIGAGAALVVLLAVVPFAGTPRPAMASSVPADGVTLASAPTEVELAFTEPVRDFHVEVHDSAGRSVTRGEARLGGPDLVRQPVDVTGSGAVTVTYHVGFAGGETLTGTLRFGVGSTTGADGAAPAHEHDIDPLGAVLLLLDGAVVAGAVLLFLRKRRRRAP